MDTHTDVPMQQTMPPRINQPSPLSPPTVQTLSAFLARFFPIRAKDVPFTYHTPRTHTSTTATNPVSRIVFSITPTKGVYTALSQPGHCNPVAFLHRPFQLDRRRVRRDATVLSSHVGFDEVLTVGWNTVLASRLGVDVAGSACVQGYKGDLERRIGIVGGMKRRSVSELVTRIEQEFGSLEGAFGSYEDQDVTALAIMNAFHSDEVDRVLDTAHEHGWIGSQDASATVLYLTGQVREAGLTYALERGFKVVCVGHRAAEEWGMRYLASRTREEFPLVDVVEVYEDEERRPPRDSNVAPRPLSPTETAAQQGL